MPALGLIVSSAPWCGRSGRDQLDLALAAASTLESLDLYFVGDGVLQLLEREPPADGGLPSNHAGWRALDTLTELRAWAEAGRLPADLERAAGVLPGVRFVPAADMPALQAGCERLLVL